MNPEIKSRWVERLRSGLPQTTGALCKVEGDQESFCCLGVLSDIAREDGIVARRIDEGNTFIYFAPDGSDQSDAALPRVVAEWAGLYVNGYPDRSPGAGGRNLAALNDTGATFNEIADIIEEDL